MTNLCNETQGTKTNTNMNTNMNMNMNMNMYGYFPVPQLESFAPVAAALARSSAVSPTPGVFRNSVPGLSDSRKAKSLPFLATKRGKNDHDSCYRDL